MNDDSKYGDPEACLNCGKKCDPKLGLCQPPCPPTVDGKRFGSGVAVMLAAAVFGLFTSGCVSVERYKWDMRGADSLGYMRGLDAAMKIFDQGEAQEKRNEAKERAIYGHNFDDDGMGELGAKIKAEVDRQLRAREDEIIRNTGGRR